MTLDEAIKHCEDVASDRAGCAMDCVEEHRQLAEWLKELKERRKSLEDAASYTLGVDANKKKGDFEQTDCPWK